MQAQGHAVVVVAEGVGVDALGSQEGATDASGNKQLPEVGPFLTSKVREYFQECKVEVTVK